jgi:hypothetical protein
LIEVERARIDVDEDGRRILVQNAVGGGDERERRRDDLVAGADARGADAQMQPRGTARHSGGMLRSHRLRERLLEAVEHRAEREPPRPQDVEDELLLAFVDVGAGERNRPRRGLGLHASARVAVA